MVLEHVEYEQTVLQGVESEIVIVATTGTKTPSHPPAYLRQNPNKTLESPPVSPQASPPESPPVSKVSCFDDFSRNRATLLAAGAF
ncbi:unnamed protein product [Amoebophrya sp. A120]|nr:unnamed protein product [Amoebophrya sp. A120]|eukprot:GSA120T00025148001.1